uniref:Uncharacterized protein n=1 Tax=Parascaris univalens TaxID=6257 RepID=A0A915CD67_PARUN
MEKLKKKQFTLYEGVPFQVVVCQVRHLEMIHVFNSPIDPSSMNEFQRSKRKDGEQMFKNATVNKRKVTYTKDGRRLVDGKIESEQKPNELWSAALTRSMASDWKGRCDDRLAQNGRSFWQHLQYFNGQYQLRTNGYSVCALVVINIVLFALLLYYFLF